MDLNPLDKRRKMLMEKVANICDIDSEKFPIVIELIQSIDYLWNSHDLYSENLEYIIKAINALPKEFKSPFAKFYLLEIISHLKILKEMVSETRQAKRHLFKIINDDENSGF